MAALRLVAAMALLLAAGVLLFIAGTGIYFAISTASDGIGGPDEREKFTAAVINGCWLPAGVALLIAGTALWQRTSLVFRALFGGIGLLLIPLVAAWLMGPGGQYPIPIGPILALVLPVAFSGLAAAYWLRAPGENTAKPPALPPTPADTRHRKRRIAAFVIALIATAPLMPLVFFVAAISFDPLEAGQEPDAWAGIAVILFGIGGVALVIVAARALVRPQRSMLPFGAVAGWFVLDALLAFARGLDEWIVPIVGSALSLLVGWLGRVPEDENDS